MRAGYRMKSKVLRPAMVLVGAEEPAMAPQRDWYTTDYYKTLGVSDKATDKELRRAYRKLAKEFHPDSHPGSEERFKAVSAAYDVLGDPRSARSTTRSAVSAPERPRWVRRWRRWRRRQL